MEGLSHLFSNDGGSIAPQFGPQGGHSTGFSNGFTSGAFAAHSMPASNNNAILLLGLGAAAIVAFVMMGK